MYPLPKLRGQLGAVSDQKQAQLLVDFGVAIQSPLTAIIQQLQNVAKYGDSELYATLANEVTTLLDQSGKLEQEINQVPVPMDADTEKVLSRKVADLAKPVESLRLRVLTATRAGVEQKTLRTAVWSVSIGMLAVGLGWLLYARVPKRRRR